MKLLKWIALCSAFFSASMAWSAPKNNVAKETYTVQTALSIDAQEREMIIDPNGQALSQFKYKITNHTNKPIVNIQWVSVYEHNRQVMYSQDMQLDLENTLQPNKSLTINLQIPFAKIEEKFRPAFLNTQEKIHVYKIARVIEFSDKTILTEQE